MCEAVVPNRVHRGKEKHGMSSTQHDEEKVDERKTKELCGHEHNGLRCMRSKDHQHEHAAYTAAGAVTWERSR
jgi:hypothetical protein